LTGPVASPGPVTSVVSPTYHAHNYITAPSTEKISNFLPNTMHLIKVEAVRLSNVVRYINEVFIKPPRPTQPGHSSVGTHNEYWR